MPPTTEVPPRSSFPSAAPRPVREEPPEVLGDVLGMLAHDVRNPLAALSSNVGYLTMVGESLSTDVKETIADLQLSIEVLGRMADAIEVLSGELLAISSGQAVPVSAVGVVHAIWPAVERAGVSHNVRTGHKVSTDARGKAVEVHLRRALAALLHNAVACSPPGGTVLLTCEPAGSELVYRVDDSGHRLEREFRDVAFWASGQMVTKGKVEGRYSRGLGLYIAGRSARLAGVTLRVADVPVGNRFELVVPLQQ
jgi:K+-sensing histidine kinase KdpD